MNSLQQELERYKQQHGGSFGNGGYSPKRSGGKKVDMKSVLMPDETILWEGYGKAPKFAKSSGITQKFFAIFWLAFSIVWTMLASMGSAFMALFGVPFIIIGICLLFQKTPKPHYAITNMRVLSDVNGNFNTTGLVAITSARIQHNGDGTADIYFTTENSVPVYNQNDMYILGLIISGIENGDNVYNIFENAVYDSKKTSEVYTDSLI